MRPMYGLETEPWDTLASHRPPSSIRAPSQFARCEEARRPPPAQLSACSAAVMSSAAGSPRLASQHAPLTTDASTRSRRVPRRRPIAITARVTARQVRARPQTQPWAPTWRPISNRSDSGRAASIGQALACGQASDVFGSSSTNGVGRHEGALLYHATAQPAHLTTSSVIICHHG